MVSQLLPQNWKIYMINNAPSWIHLCSRDNHTASGQIRRYNAASLPSGSITASEVLQTPLRLMHLLRRNSLVSWSLSWTLQIHWSVC